MAAKTQQKQRRRIDRRHIFFLIFAFSLTAVLGFLGYQNLLKTEAIHSAYSGFRAGNIITDYVMADYNSMSESDIYNFLKSKSSCNDTGLGSKGSISNGYVAAGTEYGVRYNYQLTFNKRTGGTATYHYHVENGHFVCMADESFNGESAAHIIYRAAQDYHINPKVLIVLLEKEQGLLTDPWPNTTLEYRSATGYGCPDTAACDSAYYGFKNQIRNAAELYRYILDHGSKYYPVGNNYIKYNPDASCGGSTVYIENNATSALYQYTPYQPNAATLNTAPGVAAACGANGNINFYYYYTSWFGDTHANLASEYLPSDTFTIQASSGKYLAPEANTQSARLTISSGATVANRQYTLERTGNYYYIKHVASGLYLDVEGAGTADGTAVQLYAKNNTCAQKWAINVNGSGYTIRSACSTKAIDIPANNVNAEGLKLNLWTANGSNAQRWTFTDLASAPLADGTYVLETGASKAMDVDGGRYNNATRMHTYNLTYFTNQQFAIFRGKDGMYTIKHIPSNRVLDVAAGSTANGAAVQLYDSNGSCAQRWIAVKSGSGYTFKSSCSNKAIDVPAGNTSLAYQKLQIYDANNTKAQVWYPCAINAVSNGTYRITSALNDKLSLDIFGGSEKSQNGTNVQIYANNDTNAQKWRINYVASARAYTIYNATANRMLDISAANMRTGTNVQVWAGNNTCAQYWRIRRNGDGTYTFLSACGERVLDVAAGLNKSGANVQIWSLNLTAAQRWKLTSL